MRILAEGLRFPEGPAFAADGALWCVELKGGNLVFTCPNDGRTEPTGFVCCRAADGTLTRIADGLHFANGLAFTGDELVIAETYKQRLWRGRWDAQARCWHGRVWAEGLLGAPGPDGMAFAADGTLWVAVYGSGQLMAVDAAGRIIRRIDLPGRNPTNCAFDPSGRLGLVVTEAEKGLLLSFPELGPGLPLHAGPA